MEEIAKTIWGEFMGLGLSKSQERKVQIIHSAIKIFAKEGAESLTYDLLAKKCGVTRQLIIHYFPDRVDIIKWGARFVRAHMQKFAVDQMSKYPSNKDQLTAYTRSTFEWTRNNPEYAKFWLYYYYLCSIKKTFKETNSILVEMGHKRILALLQSGYSKGEFANEPTLMSAKQIQNIITSGLLTVMTEDYQDIGEKIEDWTVKGVMAITE